MIQSEQSAEQGDIWQAKKKNEQGESNNHQFIYSTRVQVTTQPLTVLQAQRLFNFLLY